MSDLITKNKEETHFLFTLSNGDFYFLKNWSIVDLHVLISNVQQSDSVTHMYTTPLQYSCLENPMDGGAW